MVKKSLVSDGLALMGWLISFHNLFSYTTQEINFEITNPFYHSRIWQLCLAEQGSQPGYRQNNIQYVKKNLMAWTKDGIIGVYNMYFKKNILIFIGGIFFFFSYWTVRKLIFKIHFKHVM